MDIESRLASHVLWLNEHKSGRMLNLSNENWEKVSLKGARLGGSVLKKTNLAGADLIEANLEASNLWMAHLNGANLTGGNLRNAFLNEANLSQATLKGALLVDSACVGTDFRDADLTQADLTRAILCRANFGKTTLRNANLWLADCAFADFSDADFTDADLREADFSDACLTGAKGLVTEEEWLNANLEETRHGWIAYRRQYGYRTAPKDWVFEPGEWLTVPDLNQDRRHECGGGVHAATLDWIKRKFQYQLNKPSSSRTQVWKVFIPYESTIVVPYATDGKLRADRLKLLKRINV